MTHCLKICSTTLLLLPIFVPEQGIQASVTVYLEVQSYDALRLRYILLQFSNRYNTAALMHNMHPPISVHIYRFSTAVIC